jgi:SAM-dependent methyltransferase
MSTALQKLRPTDSEETNAYYSRWKYVIPLPPDGLMWSTGGATREVFVVLGDAWAQFVTHFTPPDATLLDIGCGCGRTARVLINNRWVTRYVGFDVVPDSIKWCNNFIKPTEHCAVEFHWADLHSNEYNPQGAIKASEFRFPVETKTVDVVFASSLFTHLLEPDCIHYINEVGRVLTSRGVAILSIHNVPAEGTRFSGTELRIDIESEYFKELAAQAGLEEVERVDDFGGQQVFILRPKT